MKRRDLLKLGAAAGVGGSGCASLLANPAAAGAEDMNGFLAALDDAMAGIMPGQPFETFFQTGNRPELAARARQGEELTRKTLRSLLLVGTLKELSAEQMAHEGVQQRLRDSMGEFDDAMFGMTEVLEGLGPTERASVAKALREDPQLGMRIMGTFDEEAAAMGISFTQRTKLRAISSEACARLKQSPDLAIADYVGKVRKIEARHGARAEAQRRAAAAIGSAFLWQQSEGLETSGFHPVAGGSIAELSDGGVALTPPPIGIKPVESPTPTSTPAAVRCSTPKDCKEGETCGNYRDLGNGKWSQGVCKAEPKKGRWVSTGFLTAGGIVLGVGALAAGGLVLSSNGLAAATVGAIVGALGLLALIIGLIVLATGN